MMTRLIIISISQGYNSRLHLILYSVKTGAEKRTVGDAVNTVSIEKTTKKQGDHDITGRQVFQAFIRSENFTCTD